MKFSNILKRIEKLMPRPPQPDIQYIAYWGNDPEAQDTSDFLAVWGGKDVPTI